MYRTSKEKIGRLWPSLDLDIHHTKPCLVPMAGAVVLSVLSAELNL